MPTIHRLAMAAALSLSFGLPTLTATAQDYPNRALRLVVPFPPGGGTDLVARNVSQRLSEGLGQPVLVENRPGGGGLVAWTETSKAAPDGYTLVVIANNLRLYALMPTKLGFDPNTDLVPVATIASVPMLLVGSGKSTAADVRALLTAAKAAPGRVNYGTPGNGSPHHLAMALFAAETGTSWTHVPYKGTAPLTNDLLAEQVEVAFLGLSSALPHVKSGRLKAYGVAAPKRSGVAPDMATLAENGGPAFDASYWYAIAVPKGTPRPAMERLNAELVKSLNTPAMRDTFIRQGFEPMPSTLEGASKALADEVAKWSAPIAQGGVRFE